MPGRVKTDPKLWKRLKVGDRVRIVHMPNEFSQAGYFVHRHTLRAYRTLIARNRPLRVSEIDGWRMPWVRFQLRRKDGRIEYHSMLFNHDGLVLVQPRKKKATRRTAK
jgi:hypothetical protein